MLYFAYATAPSGRIYQGIFEHIGTADELCKQLIARITVIEGLNVDKPTKVDIAVAAVGRFVMTDPSQFRNKNKPVIE